jgi:methyl-accepting chemotaxis protein
MQFKVGHKIVAGFGLVIALTFALGWYQILNIGKMRDISSEIVDDDFEALRLIRQFGNSRRDAAGLHEGAWAAYFLRKAGIGDRDPLIFQKEYGLALERTRTTLREIEAHADRQQKTTAIESRKQLWQQMRLAVQKNLQLLDSTTKTANELFDLMRGDNLAQYQGLHTVLVRLRAEFAEQGQKAEDLTAQLASLAKQDVANLHAEIRTASTVALALVLIAGAIVAFLIYRAITTPLGDFMRFVEGIGTGDLTRKVERIGGDELGRLGGHLNEMVGSLNGVARQIRTATENLNAATAEMQASVQQQAAGTNEQNAAIQQITSTLGEITRSGTQITERAKAVATTAEAAASASKSGLQAVNDTTRAMNGIRDQAEKVAGNIVALTEKTQSIGTIIATVNDLAERSSLLALNAAIEAAAAGEHGLSFAVVADEMKNLASQAKEATVEVRAILGDVQHGIGAAVMQTEEAVKRVESGKEQAVGAEQTINNLARSVEQSVATFEQIVAATNQQQVGIEQVTQSVHSIREASEQMASGGKEVGRAAANLAALSSQLQKAVERYRV